MTLIEVMVAISIFTIGIAGFSMLLMRGWQTNSYTLEMGQTSMAISQDMNKVGNFIRGARQADDGSYPVKSANSNDLVIFSDYDKDDITERLHFYKSGENLIMGITNPNSTMPKTYPSGDQETQVVCGHVVNNATTPIFSYYNKNYPGDITNNPMSVPASVGDVRLIKLDLHINIDPNRPPDNIQMQTFIEMRNLNDYDRIK